MSRIPPPGDPKFFVPFSLYALFLAFFGAILVEVVKHEPHSHWHPEYWALACLVALLALATIYDRFFRRILPTNWEGPRPLSFQFIQDVKPAKALVLLVSRKAGKKAQTEAVRYHAASLQLLYLVHSSDSLQEAKEVESFARDTVAKLRIELVQLHDMHNIEITLKQIQSLRTSILAHGMAEHDLICDFTGMNKIASAGVVLACASREARLQYMEPTAFLDDGAPNQEAPSRPVEVSLAYDLEESET